MRRIWILVLTLFVPAAFLVATSGAVIHAPSGDTCSITGTGTAYTAVINLPPNGVEQGAFAFGAPGGTITSVVGVGAGGAASTASLPASTNIAWMMTTAAAVPGASVTASLTTSGPIPGSFTVVPANRDGTVWFDPVVCQHPKGTPVPSSKFTAQTKATYNSAKGVWRQLVTVPGAGKLIYNHRTLSTKGTPSPLVWSGKLSTSKAGQVSLTLKPTPAGLSALKAGGQIKLSVSIQFSPTGGKPSNKVVPLTLKK